MTLRRDDPRLSYADQETEVWQLGSDHEPEAKDLLSARLIDSQRRSGWWASLYGNLWKTGDVVVS
jgi:hypothetical protein